MGAGPDLQRYGEEKMILFYPIYGNVVIMSELSVLWMLWSDNSKHGFGFVSNNTGRLEDNKYKRHFFPYCKLGKLHEDSGVLENYHPNKYGTVTT